MKTFLKILPFIISLSVYADPEVYIVKSVWFGDVLPVTGTCYLDYDTSNTSSFDGICDDVGRRGSILIRHTPDTLLNIRLKLRTEVDGDGIKYTPTGILKNNESQEAIIFNFQHTFSTGSTGEIEILLGGELELSKELSASTLFDIDITDGLEVEEN